MKGNLDLAFTAIEFAVRKLKEGDPESALRGLESCRIAIAKETLKTTEAHPESPFVAEIIDVVLEKFAEKRNKS